jgi:RNase adapter protein RapZ
LRGAYQRAAWRVFLTSFGYKYGIPHDSDMILDVRFLPNPYFVGELRGKSGRQTARWMHIVLGNEETGLFLERLYVAARVHAAALRPRR